MNEMLILYVAIGVFTLMLIGLGLTVREFRTNIIVTDTGKRRIDSAEITEAASATPGRVPNVPTRSAA